MHVKWLSPKTLVDEYLVLTKDDDIIDEDALMNIVSETVDRMVDAEVWTYGLVLLEVNGYRAILPDNFKTVDAAMYRLHSDHNVRRHEIVTQFRQQGIEKDCNLEINLVCPRCSEIDCDCHSPIIEVDIDKIWTMSHPERFAAHMRHFIGYYNNDSPFHKENKGFKLMNPNFNSFQNAPLHLGECAGLHYDYEIHYGIDNGVMNVPFKHGQVLMGYKGLQLDPDGWRMVPDNSAARQAIKFSILEVMALGDYTRTKGLREEKYWANMTNMKEKWVGRARTEMNSPTFGEWMQILKNHQTKLLPYWNWEANLSRNQKDQYSAPGATYSHRNR